MHRLRHPKLTEKKNLTKELTECFLNGLPECFLKVFKGLTEYFSRGEIYQRVDRRCPLHCIGDRATLSLHLSVDFYIIFLKCFLFISSGDSPPASRLQFALFGRESLQESRFPAHSWKFWFLFKEDISQFIPGNFYFYSNEWFSTFKKTERKRNPQMRWNWG